MNVFMHVSRLTQYPDGYVLILSKGLNFRQHSWLNILGGFMDKDFANHIETMFSEGISVHGSNYLFEGLYGDISYSSWALEMCFESIRFKEFSNRPSRLQSAFAWRDLADAQNFRKNLDCDIYAVEPLDTVAFLDMNLITGDKKLFGGAEDNAKAYWSGTKPEVQGYTPVIEVVMKCPVRILGKVT